MTSVTKCSDASPIKNGKRHIYCTMTGKNAGRVELLRTNSRHSKAMRQPRHNGNQWQRLLCLVGALLVFSAPIMASACPRGQCPSHPSKAVGHCPEMATNNDDAGSFQADSPPPCCQLTQNPPATTTPTTEKMEVQPVASNVVAEVISVKRSAINRLSHRFEVTFSPPDVQSLLCILLV